MMGKPENPELKKIIRLLRSKAKQYDAPIWTAIVKKLECSKHRRCIANISRLSRHTKDDKTFTVPGKVLGAGRLNHKVSVAAFSFSEEAKRKIEAAGGEWLPFSALIEKNPKGKDLILIG